MSPTGPSLEGSCMIQTAGSDDRNALPGIGERVLTLPW
jgi:hypothetical protein